MDMSGDYQQPDVMYTYEDRSLPPLHLCLFLMTAVALLGLSWYRSYESAAEALSEQMRLGMLLMPVALLVAVHWMSSEDGRWVPFFLQLPGREFVHRAGTSPWGIAVLLGFLILVVSRRSSFIDAWSPLVSIARSPVKKRDASKDHQSYERENSKQERVSSCCYDEDRSSETNEGRLHAQTQEEVDKILEFLGNCIPVPTTPSQGGASGEDRPRGGTRTHNKTYGMERGFTSSIKKEKIKEIRDGTAPRNQEDARRGRRPLLNFAPKITCK